ncbi:hypothetical protein B0H13DRAFT_2506791 [Mycena leptocephala]|nr:hypothetical protein B0H13DRAFT_2506791 [Mycena leptocephala]
MRIAHTYPLPPPSWSAFSPLTWQAALPPTCVSEARAPISALPSPTRCLGLLMGDAARCDLEMGAGGQRDLEIGEIYIPHDIAEIVARIWKARGAGRVGGDVYHKPACPESDKDHRQVAVLGSRRRRRSERLRPRHFHRGPGCVIEGRTPPFRRSSHTLTRIPFDTTNPPPQRLSAGLCDTHAPHASSNYGWTQPPPVDVTAPNATIQHFQIQSYTRPLEIVVVTIRFRALGLRSWPARLPSRPSTENCASRHSRCPRRYEPASARIRWLGMPYTPEFCSCRAPRREFYRVKALSLGIRDARAANALTHCRVSMPVRPPTALWRVPDYVPSYTAMRAGREMACAFPHSPLCLRARAAMQRFARPRKQEAAQSPTLRSGSRKARAPRSQLALGAHAAEEWRNRLSNEK